MKPKLELPDIQFRPEGAGGKGSTRSSSERSETQSQQTVFYVIALERMLRT